MVAAKFSAMGSLMVLVGLLATLAYRRRSRSKNVVVFEAERDGSSDDILWI